MNRTRKTAMLVLGMVLGSIGAVAAAPLLTTVSTRVVGPFFTTPMAFDSANINQVGGHVQYYLAADSAWIGQVVYFVPGSKNQVKAGVSYANQFPAGVVVGGSRTSMQSSIARADSMTLVAIAGQRVIVMDEGRYWVLDSNAGKSPGALIRGSVGSTSRTSGRAVAANQPDTNNRAVGRMVDSMVASTNGLVQIHVK